MARNRRQPENLDKDADSRKSTMKALKSYVKDLDSKAIPIFLAQVSETKETGFTSDVYTISLYEVLARVHGTKIVPQIDNIMSTIIKTLPFSAGSFGLHQACSKVVSAIARYGIDPTTPVGRKREIIHSLCKPLSDSLLASEENLLSGTALCLKALVDSDNWRFCSSELVNEVCQRAAGALMRPMQSNSHMGLVMALVKHNGLVMEAYARLLIRSGIGILNMDVAEGNSQKRLSAIQMVNNLMKCLDYKCIMSELGFVIEELEKCQGDQMAYVKGAAFEAIQTAKRILTEKGSRHERQGNTFCDRDRSPLTVSPESQTVVSFGGYTSMVNSPFSISFASRGAESGTTSVNPKLWRRVEDSCVDVSLKDGLFSGGMSTPRSVIQNSEHSGLFDNQGDNVDWFSEFLQTSPRNGGSKSVTPSPQPSCSYVNVDNVKILMTPRKLVKSLQVPDDVHSDSEQSRRFRSPSSSKNEPNGPSCDLDDEQFHGAAESVSSTEDIPQNGTDNTQQSQELVPETKPKSKMFSSAPSVVCDLFVLLLAVVVCFLWIRDLDKVYNLVPT